MLSSFKKDFTLAQRISESTRILAKYPDRIPIIIEYNDAELLKIIKKRKFLVPHDVSVSYLNHIIRNKIKIDSSKAIFMFYENILLNSTSMIGELYEKYKKNNKEYIKGDKFFYITLSYENTFGYSLLF